MLQSDLATRLQIYFQNSTYYQSIDLNDSIQDGYDEVAAFSGCILKAVSLPFVNGLSYYDMYAAGVTDYIGVVAIFNTVINRWMWPTSTRKLSDVRIDWETAAGTPWYFVPINHRFLAIYKKPIVNGYGNFFMFYRAAAPTLASSDTIAIPDDYALCLQDYSITDLWEQNQEWSKAVIHAQAYRKTLEDLRIWAQSKKMPDRLPSLKG